MTRSLTASLSFLLLVAAVAPAAIGPAAAADVTLTVTVEDFAGTTVEGADLTATWDGGSTTETTSANGQAFVDVPEGADVTITVDHDRYMRNHPSTVEDARARDVRIEVARQGEATVTVRDPDPVEGASVRFLADGRTAVAVRTDDDGVATTGPIERGSYDVAVTKPGYLEERFTVGVRDDTERSVSIARGTVQVAFDVRDDHFEDPRSVENATIEIEPIGVSLVTLPDGRATTALPVNRNYEVTISKPGYEQSTRNLGVGEGDTTLVAEINRQEAVTLAAANRRVVVGESTRVTATDEYGTPIEDAAVSVDGTEVARTDADGEADVPIESAGNVTIRATRAGSAATVTVEGVQPGATTTAAGNDTTTDGGTGPGFGPIVALVAVALAAGLLRRSR